MKLEQRFVRELVIVSIVFVLFLATSAVFFSQTQQSIQHLLAEGEPTAEIIEHMIIDTYEDNNMLFEYLSTQTFADALALDPEVQAASQLCNDIEHEAESLMMSKAITSKFIIRAVDETFDLSQRVDATRDELLNLHKKELETRQDFSAQKQVFLQEHTRATNEAVTRFKELAQEVRVRDAQLKEELEDNFRMFVIVIAIGTFGFIGFLIFRIKRTAITVAKPIDSIIDAANDFVQGNYDAQATPVTKISEIEKLGRNTNKVFGVIKRIASEDPREKRKINAELLRQEYIDILELVQQHNLAKKRTNIVDIKKALHITHPTALSRLRWLQDEGYIDIKKEGRDKFVLFDGEL